MIQNPFADSEDALQRLKLIFPLSIDIKFYLIAFLISNVVQWHGFYNAFIVHLQVL